MLSNHYFGDVEAIDEGKNHTDYFRLTYLMPSSFSISTINNKNKYLIIGRKGTGKTAAQFNLSKQLEGKKFFTHFFSFHNDLSHKDFVLAVKNQSIDILEIQASKSSFQLYDFREVWIRTFFIKIAETLIENGFETSFTKLATDGRGKFRSIFDGLLKSLNVKISSIGLGMTGEIGIDASKIANGEVALSDLNSMLKALILKHHPKEKIYLFVDELVFSRLDKTEDEFRVRAAMVRDIFRSCRDLNNFFASKNIDMHIVCTLRPEIRDVITISDSEIGKIFDSKSVVLEWDASEEYDNSLMQILKNKIIHSDPDGNIVDFDEFFAKSIVFGEKSTSIPIFLLSNTWGRPRDVVQLLNSISARNPNATRITEKEIKNSLADFSRKSFIELMEEISVIYGTNITEALRQNIKNREYKDIESFMDSVFRNNKNYDLNKLADDLFRIGVIGNIDKSKNPVRFHWAHRGDTYLSREMQIMIHRGLWHYLHLQ